MELIKMIQIFNSKQKREIEENLKKQFGIEEIPGEIIKLGEEKLFLFTGNLNEKGIRELEEIAPVEKVGVYFAKIIREDAKLSIEGSQILKDQIKKNIFDLDAEQAEKWMKGEELNIKSGKRGFLVMRYKDNFLGCGNASEEKITNFIPKTRRLKNRLN